MTYMPDMKPCPFCGEAKIETSLVQGGPFAPRNACSSCGATGPVEHHITIGSKADAWNTRHINEDYNSIETIGGGGP